jgi:hypothetical protein
MKINKIFRPGEFSGHSDQALKKVKDTKFKTPHKGDQY